MDFINNLAIGFGEALTLTNLFYCLLGCILGTLIGILPGLGPSATIAMLLPVTFTLEPTTALIMLAGIYYGAQYGGSTTAILINLPGEPSSVVTALDGYQMARKGKAGLALATAALGSFFAGTAATLLIAVAAPLLASLALTFQAAEYFSLMVLGLIASVALAHGSMLKALVMIVAGLLVGLVGVDVTSGAYRMTFDVPELLDGVSIVAVAMGIFGLGEIVQNLSGPPEHRVVHKTSLRGLLPSKADLRRMARPVLRGTALGSVVGILPGGGALLASFASYAIEKKLSKNPEEFGNGALEGVAGPEAANNAAAQTSFIPMLTLGIPTGVVMAMMVGGLIVKGIQPGPSMIRDQPELFWGLIASMWIGNLMLVVLNLPMVGMWVRLLTLPYKYLYPAIMTFCAVGVFTLGFSVFDIYVMAAFGLIGFVLRRLDCEPAPFLLGLVLGPMMEEFLRRALLLSRGDPMVFIERPISAVMLGLALLFLMMMIFPHIRSRRDETFKEE